ncbi:MAG: hypothetical protein J6S57_02395, partial [Alphaproteobacteria bacterium]|nr:hypothetical protein [Alphaproteobacteria bacterium]
MKDKLLNIIGILAVCVAIVIAVFLTKEKTMQSGIQLENMDLYVKPGDDFYDFATAGWRKNNPLPDDYVRFGSFEELDKTNMERAREIAEQDTGKVGMLYNIVMNADKLNAEKTTPVKPYLDEIDNIKTVSDLPKYLGKMQTFSSAFWNDGVALDDKDSDHYIFIIGQGGIGLSRDYYFDDDKKSIEVRKKYQQYIKTLTDNFDVRMDADKIYALEERMAKSFYKKEKLRNPLVNYHKKSFDELKRDFPGFDWDTFFEARGIKPEFVNVMQPEPITESIAIINDTDIETIKMYLN